MYDTAAVQLPLLLIQSYGSALVSVRDKTNHRDTETLSLVFLCVFPGTDRRDGGACLDGLLLYNPTISQSPKVSQDLIDLFKRHGAITVTVFESSLFCLLLDQLADRDIFGQ